MIIKPATHLFDAMPPKLDDGEKELWFRHPKWPVQCNQLGVLIFDDDVQVVRNARDQYYLMYGKKVHERHFMGGRARIVMECFHQISYEGFQFHHRDCNPYNFTEANLVGFRYKCKEMMEFLWNNQRFVDRTIAYMNTRTAVLQKRGIDPVQYWKMMEIPKKVFNTWIKQSDFKPPDKESRGKYKIEARRYEVISTIKAMKAQGKTNAEIGEVLGITSKNGLTYWLKIIKAESDI